MDRSPGQETRKRRGLPVDIKRLERESRPYLFLGAVIGITIHAFLAVTVSFDYRGRMLTAVSRTQSVHVPIRLITVPGTSKTPFSIRNKSPQRRSYVRIPGAESAMPVSPLTGRRIVSDIPKLLTDTTETAMDSGISTAQIDTSYRRNSVYKFFDDSIRRKDEMSISPTEELLDVQGLDTGEYPGLIVIDPDNRHNLRGFLHMPSAIFGYELAPANTGYLLRRLDELHLARHTGIRLKLDQSIRLSDRKLLDYPFIYLTANKPFELTDEEKKNLSRYIHSGGFLLMEGLGNAFDDGCNRSIAASSMKKAFDDLVGSGVRWQYIDDSHEFFHCYFDLTVESGYNYYRTNSYDCPGKQSRKYLDALFFEGRLAVVLSEKGYGYGWDMEGPQSAYSFGINTIVYAMKHQGGTTQKLVDSSTITIIDSRRFWDYDLLERYRSTDEAYNRRQSITR